MMAGKVFLLISLILPTVLVTGGAAETFYVDPASGSMSNDGSETSPWETLQGVFDNNKIETKDKAGIIKNAGAPVKAGDTIVLLSGYHGDIYESVYFNDDYITIEAKSGHTPELKRFRLSGGKKWILRGLDISPSLAPVFERVTMVNFYSRNTSDGICSDITIEDCNLYTIADSSGWSTNDWDTKACNGINLGMDGGAGLAARNNYILNVNYGITAEAQYAVAEENIIENFSGDGITATYHDVVVKYNLIKNCYAVNANHDDGIQSYLRNVGPGAVYRVTLIGNIIINTSSPSQPHQGTLQGIGIFDGPFYDFVVENNVVLTDHYHGITLLNSQNGRIINNTVFSKWYYDRQVDRATWIMVTAASTSGGNIVYNNIAHDIDASGDSNAQLSHNLIMFRSDDANDWFTDYSNFDMHLTATSPAVSAGSGILAPAEDVEGNPRPSGGFDIGAYEYMEAGDNISPSTDAGADQIGVDADDNGSETVTLDGSASYDPDGTIASYIWKEDGNQIAEGISPSVSLDVDYHTIVLEATDSNGATGRDTVIIIVNTPTAVTSTYNWQNLAMTNRTGSFTFHFDIVPHNNNIDALVGVAKGTADSYGDLACILRFNTGGNMDARNGGSYTADTTVPYSAGTSYDVRMDIDVTSHRYSIYVTPEGEAEATLADNYAFRTEQSSVSSLDHWVILSKIGPFTIDNVTTCLTDDMSAADFNGDCVVDYEDVARMVRQWLSDNPEAKVDLYVDGVVNFQDYAVLAGTWLEEKI